MNKYAPLDELQIEYLNRSQDSWLNVAEGGKRGAKNVLNALCYCIALENHPDKLHLIGGVSQSTAKLNILDCDGYGLLNYFYGRCREGKYQGKDCLYINTIKGQKVILIAGGAKDGDEKYIKGNTYGTAYITEANECHKKFIQEVMDRTLSSNNRKIFHDLNPKPPAHWYYTDFIKFHEDQQSKINGYGYNYGHFNIFNNLSISDDKLKRILSTYDKNSIWYKRDILGQRIASAGILFDLIANNKERYLTDDNATGLITTGVDFGKRGSKHAFCSQVITRDYRNILTLRSDEEDCTTQDGVDDSDGIGVKLSQLRIGFLKHVKWVLVNYGKIDYVFCDCAEPQLIDFLQKTLENENIHIPVRESIKIPIEDRIHLIGVLLMQDRLKFKNNDTFEIIKSLQEATQDDKADTDRWLDDGTSDIDILDAFVYGIEHWHRELMLL